MQAHQSFDAVSLGRPEGFCPAQECWRPVRESNPYRRREREATYCNSTELRGMDSTFTAFDGLTETLIGLLVDSHFPGVWRVANIYPTAGKFEMDHIKS
jgi:hypothetical protein